ncbi:DUF4367 domain-containing protein [Natrarchaeobius sp. A-rgal3]|uniref:DUF4367 domain-containing protein n=1 Tax=Natrarchaeobius versutus TaxID=1679078 RepID=UPI003510C7C1
MIPDWSLPKGAAIGVALLLVLAGCTAAPITGDDVDAAEVVEKVEQRHDEIEDVHGVQQTTVDDGEEVTTTTAEVWEKPPNQYREEVLSSTADYTEEGDTTVADGTQVWSYTADDDTVRTFEFEDDAALGATGFEDEELVDEYLEAFDVEYDGTETVADREAHVLRLTPSEDGDENVAEVYDEIVLWIDDEYWYPLKQQAEMDTEEHSMAVTITFEEIEFNAGVEDDRFAFDPPEDAEVVSLEDITTEEFETLEDASEAAPFDVAEPDVPEGYALDRASVTDDGTGGVTVTATYTDADGEYLSLSVVADRDVTPSGESVTVDGSEATLVDGSLSTLYWECGDLEYTLSGDLEGEELTEIAETVDCQ